MADRKKVLFVCIGNICRSPMAEAMARTYGSDVMEVSSAGVAPAMMTCAETRGVLRERNIDLGDHLPRRVRDLDLSGYDLVVNMSGRTLKAPAGVRVENWTVTDPIGRSEEVYREVCGRIEMLVMNLILRIRTGKFDEARHAPAQ